MITVGVVFCCEAREGGRLSHRVGGDSTGPWCGGWSGGMVWVVFSRDVVAPGAWSGRWSGVVVLAVGVTRCDVHGGQPGRAQRTVHGVAGRWCADRARYP